MSKSKAKYYGVKNGRKTGVFNSLKEFQKQVKDFQGAEGKGFKTKAEAEEYVGINKTQETRIIKPKDKRTRVLDAYVDGSFSPIFERYGWGLVILENDNIKIQSFGGGIIEELVIMRHIAGEIIAAGKAIEVALSEKATVKTINIYYDCEGIADWVEKGPPKNEEYIRRYSNFCKKAMCDVNVIFHKVKAHSNNKYNDMADRLAKTGAGVS